MFLLLTLNVKLPAGMHFKFTPYVEGLKPS